MPNHHLIHKLKSRLDECDILLYRRKRLHRDIGGKVVECIGYWDGDGKIEIALLGHTSVDDIIHTVIHELCHAADYNEEAVEGGLDDASYKSRGLREAVMHRLLEIVLRV